MKSAGPHPPPSPGDEDAAAIAIMGPTGAGKTSFVNLVSGSNLLVGGKLHSCTKSVQFGKDFQLDERNIILIDTPGFDDTGGTDAKIFRMMASFLAKSYQEGKQLAGVIYMHRISDVRMGGTASRNFKLAMSVCGMRVMTNVVIVTTFWDGEDEEDILREEELKNSFFSSVLQKGARMVRHDRTKENAHDIIRLILENRPAPLTIQTELIDQRIHLKDTTAAKEIFGQFYSQLNSHEEDLKKLQATLQALPIDKEDQKQGIIEQARKLEATIAGLRAEARVLAEKFEEQDKQLQELLNQKPLKKKRRGLWKNTANVINKFMSW